jgi:hypothetical protein
MDLYSRRIVGWAMDKTLASDTAAAGIRNYLKTRFGDTIMSGLH